MSIIDTIHYVPTAFGDFELRDIPADLVHALVLATDGADMDRPALISALDAIEDWAEQQYMVGA